MELINMFRVKISGMFRVRVRLYKLNKDNCYIKDAEIYSERTSDHKNLYKLAFDIASKYMKDGSHDTWDFEVTY